jgi:hypothetical protein
MLFWHKKRGGEVSDGKWGWKVLKEKEF